MAPFLCNCFLKDPLQLYDTRILWTIQRGKWDIFCRSQMKFSSLHFYHSKCNSYDPMLCASNTLKMSFSSEPHATSNPRFVALNAYRSDFLFLHVCIFLFVRWLDCLKLRFKFVFCNSHWNLIGLLVVASILPLIPLSALTLVCDLKVIGAYCFPNSFCFMQRWGMCFLFPIESLRT